MRSLRNSLLAFLIVGMASANILPLNLGVGRFIPAQTGGRTLKFNCATFGGTGCDATAMALTDSVVFNGTQVQMTTGTSHQGGAIWYRTLENIQSFSTQFTFKVDGFNGNGVAFTIQNTNATTNPGKYGLSSSANSANGMGYGAGGGSSQPAEGNSVGLIFNAGAFNQGAGPSPGYFMPVFTSVGLYVDGGPAIGTNGPAQGFAAQVDLQPTGLNIGSNDLLSATVTYDGTTLTLVLTDTVTGGTTRTSWPVNIPAIVGANTAYVGFMSDTAGTSGINYIDAWEWWNGVNTSLSSPTFSPTPGQYTSTQSVSINCPSGATCYYTTNGLPPTSSSTQYTGTPISVSASEILQAVAIETNYTDSAVALGNYRIQASATPVINFPSSFSSVNGLIQPVGYATISGGNINLTDNLHYAETSAAWYAAPVSVSTFNTTFTFTLSSVSENGFAFVLQNYPQTSTGTNYNWTLGNGPYGVVTVSGGPFTLSSYGTNLGYTDIFNSVAIIFDTYDGSGDLTGLYTDGAVPTGSSLDMTSSGVSLKAGGTYTVNLAYDGTNLVETVTDSSSHQFTHTYTPVNIPSIVGSTTAYAGFTASSSLYLNGSVQTINSWTY